MSEGTISHRVRDGAATASLSPAIRGADGR